jgi:uncharacterized protein YndB with AHSA1/START domain
MRSLLLVLLLLLPASGAERHRVIVSSDIGGTDPDDFQSMVHFLLYADVLDVEGIISSPYGPGRREHIFEVIDRYDRDYPSLVERSSTYPKPAALRALAKQGALDSPGRAGVANTPTEGSNWIVQCARRADPRPLYVLVWGGIEDLAQALHDAPDILPKLRVYFIGGPNKMWSVDAYHYIEQNHPKLWMIESNATYRGWFTGGDQSGEWSNREFVTRRIVGRGALGDYFASKLQGVIKMGDSPSVTYLLNGDPANPEKPGWGGRYVPIWDGRLSSFNRLTTDSDKAEVFGTVDFSIPVPAGAQVTKVLFDNRVAVQFTVEGNRVRFRFSPRDAKVWKYEIEGAGLTGSFTAAPPPRERTSKRSKVHPNWWIDDPDPVAAEGVHPGAKSVNQWRHAFLQDFATRLERIPSTRERVIVLTDIENEPDDQMSLVRFLTYSNHWDVEGLVATTSVHQQNKTAAYKIREVLEAYGKVRDNLLLHEPGFPDLAYLQSVVREGRADFGMRAVGEGMDSPGSNRIIEVVDRAGDSRPVWVLVWGGPNCLAQALWKVRATRTPAEVEKFASRLRVYTISDQDDTGPWIRKNFPGVFYIASPGYHAAGAYHQATWSGISGDHFHGRFGGGDFAIVDNPWLDQHIRNKGPLGAQYPQVKFLMEGDSPSFLYLIHNGLGDSEHPDWGSWGGRYEFYTPRLRKWHIEQETRPFWSDAEDEVLGLDGYWHTSNKATIWRWRRAYQNDFAARMDWTVKPFKEANHPPVPKLAGPDRLTVKSGERVRLNAAGSTDPDGNALDYSWFYYGEPSSLPISTARTGNPLAIEGADKAEASFVAPKVAKPETVHLVLAVTDRGTPALTRYKRVIVTVTP